MAEASLIQNATKLLAESRVADAFTGAGISTPSGIPDFRSPKTGLWARLEAAGADETQAGTIQAFGRDPRTFYERMKPLFQEIITAEPNAAHYALAELEARGMLQAVITQNADMLHQRAGSKNVIEVHGSLAEATCIQCYNVKPFRPLLDQFLSDGIVPRCKECGGIPAIWYALGMRNKNPIAGSDIVLLFKVVLYQRNGKVLMKVLIILAGLLVLVYVVYYKREIRPEINTRHNLSLLGEEAPFLKEGEITFRDLNKNGRLDPYEDPRRTIEDRVEDLLAQMTLKEKAGMMFHTMISMNDDGSLQEQGGLIPMPQSSDLIASRLMNHFNVLRTAEPRQMAGWYNRIQKLAEQTRLGIPITISSDPRHAFTQNPATSMMAGKFSQFPEQTGLAAARDVELVQRFADIARQEYLAVGIRLALHPMADLATDPRWGRANGTFGEDANLASEMIAAYICGFQGEQLGAQSVACMTKHFPGAGPQKDGEDAHFPYGKEQVYPGDRFEYHLKPFEAAFKAGTAQIMPYYGMPVGLPFEKVGFGFNKDVIAGLLREKYGFDGVVCTDWMLINPVKVIGREIIPAKAWGVEHLSAAGRIQKAIEAGVDQFGGEACPKVIVELVRSGRVKEERLDQSVRRLLRDKFRLGLFDNPYVDPDIAEQTVGNPEFRKVGELAQRKSIVLLKNEEGILPLKGELKIYVENINPETASRYGRVVNNLANADIAILRLNAPYEKRKGLLESYFHAGDLDFQGREKEHILDVMSRVPTIVDIYLERPSVIPEIAEQSVALLANFGANDRAVLDVIFGKFVPQGKLPFELPASMEAVRRQKEDVPYDSENPLFPFGHGLTY